MPADIVIKTQAFPPGTVGVSYEAGIATTGNASAITGHSVASGALPPGLIINASDHLRLSGVPTVAGKYTFTISLTDAAGTTTSSALVIVISAAGREMAEGNLPITDQLKVQWPSEF